MRRGLDIGSGVFCVGGSYVEKIELCTVNPNEPHFILPFFDLNMGSCSLFKAISVEVKMRRLIHFRSNLYSCLRKANGNYPRVFEHEFCEGDTFLSVETKRNYYYVIES